MATPAEWILGLFLATVLVLGAGITGKEVELCAAMGGVYTPAPPPTDVCPGGKWSNLFRSKPEPTK